MKILFITDYFYPHIGGVEKLFTSLASELTKSNNEVTYITWRYSKSLPKREIYSNIKIIRISSFSRMLFPLIALPVIFRESKMTDLIHTSTYSSAIGAWLGAKLTGKKVIVTVHEVWGNLWNQLPFIDRFSKKLFRLLERIMLSLRFHQYIAVSNSTKKALIVNGISSSKIETIYNGIDYEVPQWNKPPKQFTFTYFGRAGISKGLDLLVGAADQIAKEHSEIRFKWIVSPQSKTAYQSLIQRIQNGSLHASSTLLSNLTFDELQKELLSSHCIVIPSYNEGFGFTAAEASAMGIPIISSGRGSLPEVVSGRVIQMETFDVNGLYAAMKKALNDEFETIALKKFETAEFVQKHIALYEKCLNNQNKK